MNQFKEHIFTQLLSNKDFVDWILGRQNTSHSKWEQWKNDHPESSREFDQACKVAKMMQFKGSQVSSQEIDSLWHEAAQRMPARSPQKVIPLILSRFKQIAAILVLPLLLTIIGLSYSNYRLNKILYSGVYSQSTTINKVYNSQGHPVSFNLSDGSTVWLNSNSTLIYPEHFVGVSRQVTLDGEGYFKIEKDKVPFVVKNIGADVKVYGTEFNVKAYQGAKNTKVVLVSGQVALLSNGNERIMNPGEIASFDLKSGDIDISRGYIDQEICWREGKFIFRDVPLGDVMERIAQKFDVDFVFEDPYLSAFRYNMTLKNESLEQILQMLALTAPIVFDYKKISLNKDGTYSTPIIRITKDKTRIVK